MAVDLIMTGSVNITSTTWLIQQSYIMCEIWSVVFVKIAAINWCCMFIGFSFGDEIK